MWGLRLFNCLAYLCPITLTWFVEKINLLPPNWICTFTKNELDIFAWIYSWVYWVLLIIVPFSLSIPESLHCCSYIMSWDQIDLFFPLFFSKFLLAILVILTFNRKFRIISSVSTNVLTGILIKNASKQFISLGRTDIFTILTWYISTFV